MTKVTAAPALTAQAFLDLANAPQKIELVENVPGIGDAYVLVMNVGQREAMRNRWSDISKKPDNEVSFSAMILQATLCDASGDLILSSLTLEQINNLPSPVTDPLVDKSLKINGFLSKAVEKERKN